MICTVICLHIIWIWASCGGVRCPGVPCGRARKSFSHHGLSGARFGRMLSNPPIRGFLQMSCCSAKFTFHWCINTESSSGGCHIMHSGGTTSPTCGCSYRKQRPWRNVIWRLWFRAVRFHSVMLAPVMWRPTHVRDKPVPSPTIADQAIPDLTGAVVYHCRPPPLPV